MVVFDLIERMKDAPIDSLAEALRRIHELRTARRASASGATTPAVGPARGAAEPRRRAPEPRRREDAALASIVSTLKRVHDRQSMASRGEGTAAAAGGLLAGSSESSYDRVRRHFHENEERLRRHALVTDRILDGLRSAGDIALPGKGAALLQQELRLLCVVGSRTGGRFVAANESGRRLELELLPGKIRGLPEGWGRRVHAQCEPARLVLEAGEERTVRLDVDLRECPVKRGDRVELTVDAVGEGQLLEKVWVEIQMVAPGTAVAAETGS